MKENSPAKVLWKDRKRPFLGLPWSFTVYTIDEDRLHVKTGFFNTTYDEILLYRILDVSCKRSFGQRIFGVGDIVLYSADKSHTDFILCSVKRPLEVKTLISRLVEEERTRRGLVGREMYGVASEGMQDGGPIGADGAEPHMHF